MASEPGMELRNESFANCHRKHPDNRGSFIQCLCESVVGLCRTASSQLPPTSVTATTPTVISTLAPPASTSTSPFVPNDWTRSYSVTAGLCALFLAMCAVIIVLRIMSKRNEPQTRSRVSVSTAPVSDSDPPPYEIVVRLPPSYISREPPPYCEIDIDKYPSPLICPRQPGNGRTTAETSDPESAAPSGQATNCAREAANCGGEAANCGGEAANCGEEASRSHGEALTTSRETASADSAAVNADLAAASTSSGASSCVAQVTVISEVEDTHAASASSSESASR